MPSEVPNVPLGCCWHMVEMPLLPVHHAAACALDLTWLSLQFSSLQECQGTAESDLLLHVSPKARCLSAAGQLGQSPDAWCWSVLPFPQLLCGLSREVLPRLASHCWHQAFPWAKLPYAHGGLTQVCWGGLGDSSLKPSLSSTCSKLGGIPVSAESLGRRMGKTPPAALGSQEAAKSVAGRGLW